MKNVWRKAKVPAVAGLTALITIGCGSNQEAVEKRDYAFEIQPEAITQVPVTGYRGAAFTAIDWDKDGDVDILETDCNDGRVYLSRNENGSFYTSGSPILQIPVTGYRGASIASVDWDNDGKIDILAVDAGTGKVYLYKNITDSMEVGKWT